MRTLVGAAIAWPVALLLWAAYGDFVSNQSWEWPRDLLVVGSYLGAPVPFAVLMMHWPILTWLKRRSIDGIVIATVSVLLAVLMVMWPVLALGGRLGDLTQAREFAALYATFGLLLELWVVIGRRAIEEEEVPR